MRCLPIAVAFVIAAPSLALGQSASEVERCFQNPAACSVGSTAPPPPSPAPPQAPPRNTRQAPAPDYAAILQAPDVERRKIQESLRTLDKYKGPIDGNLQSDATVKAIGDWQKGHGHAVTGKLTPPEAKALNDEAARVPIKRLDPSSQIATGSPTPLAPAKNSNADALKALQAKIAERRKAAEPKANAATEALIHDLKTYAAEGKGVAGEQFPGFAKWYGEVKAAGQTMTDVTPVIEDYGDAKGGAAAVAQMNLQTRQDDKTVSQCLVFAWIDRTSRKNTQTFSCDDIAAVEKWKTEQALRSAWR